MAQTALNLKFALDEYLVTWQLPPVEGGETLAAHGALTVEAGEPPRGIAHGDLDTLLEHSAPGIIGLPQSVVVPRLTGNMANGANVLLLTRGSTTGSPRPAFTPRQRSSPSPPYPGRALTFQDVRDPGWWAGGRLGRWTDQVDQLPKEGHERHLVGGDRI